MKELEMKKQNHFSVRLLTYNIKKSTKQLLEQIFNLQANDLKSTKNYYVEETIREHSFILATKNVR